MKDKFVNLLLLGSIIFSLMLSGCIKDNGAPTNGDDPSGKSGTFTDSRDGKIYNWVKIGEQVWMADNLYFTSNNSFQKYITNDDEWTNNTEADGWCYYDNDPENGEKYCVLYQWKAAKKACPDGWHLPSDDEWTILETFISDKGYSNEIGIALKSTSGWIEDGNGTNLFGFNATPGGMRNGNSGRYFDDGRRGHWWSNTEYNENFFVIRALYYNNPHIVHDGGYKTFGFSVRCIKNNENYPVANFKSNITSGVVPLTVSFTDQSTNNPTFWQWDFGDGETSSEQNPVHIYHNAGTYTVTLIVSNDYGSNTETKDAYIQVENPINNTFTDPRDGQIYNIVTIGNQKWFAENMNYETSSSWTYDNDPANGYVYGRLYTWEAALTACPSGWHLPSDEEWTELENFIAGDGHVNTEGTALKASTGWSNNGNGTNDYGFSALPGGFRNGNDGGFNLLGYYGMWWSSSDSAYIRRLGYNEAGVDRYSNAKSTGFSARCVKD